MRFVVAGSIVFAVLAILAAQLGWFDASSTVAMSSANRAPVALAPAQPPRADADEEARDGEDPAAAEADEAPTSAGPLTVTVTRAPEQALTEAVDEAPAPEEGVEEPMIGVAVRVDCPHAKLTAKTGPDGKAQFPTVPTEACTVVVREPGMAAELRPIAGGEDTEADISLSPEAKLVVHVRDVKGRSVPGARLHFSAMDGMPCGPLFAEVAPGAIAPPPPPPEPASGTAEEDGEGDRPNLNDIDAPGYVPEEMAVDLVVPPSGELALNGLGSMTYFMSASAQGYTSANTEVGLAPGASRELTVVLDQEGALSVRLEGLDDLSRAAIAVARDENSEAVSELTLGPDGAFVGKEFAPGVSRLSVAVDGVEVHVEQLAISPGAELRRVVKLALADVEIELLGLKPGAPAPNCGQTKMGCRPEAAAITLTCDGDLVRTVAVVGSVAQFPLVPRGAHCDAELTGRPLGPHAAVIAPGRATLDASRHAVRFTVAQGNVAHGRAVAPLIFTLTNLADSNRLQRVVGAPNAPLEVEGMAPGRYQVSGWFGLQALAAVVDITAAGDQEFTLRPSEPVCFRAQVVDAETGEPAPADFVGYTRTAAGLKPTMEESRPLPEGGGVCYPTASVGRLAVSAPGYRTQAFEARPDLGTIRLAAGGELAGVLSEHLRVEEDGSVLVASATPYGLRPGDRLLAIDGERVDGLVYEEVLSRLSGDANHRVRLKVRSVDGEHEVEAEPDGY